MSRGDFNLGNMDEEQLSRTVYEHEDGSETVLEGFQTETHELPDGTEQTIRTLRHKHLSDDTEYSQLMASRRKPIDLGVCQDCRHPPWRFPFRPQPRDGLVRLDLAVRCRACNALLCPRCSCRGSDGHVRCVRCHRTHSILGRFIDLFARQVRR